jgi:hypothetical protein
MERVGTKIAVRCALLLTLVFGVSSLVAQNSAPSTDEEVLLRLTAEPMPSVSEIPVVLQRVDKPGPPVELVASPGAVDAAVIPSGVYELVSQSPVEINGQRFQWQMRIPVFEHITRIRLSIANAVASNDTGSAPTVATKPPTPPAGINPVPGNTAAAEVDVLVRVDPALGSGANIASAPIELRRLDRPQPPIATTIRNGEAKLRVAPGTYEIVTVQPLLIDKREYYWDMEAPLTEPSNQVQLSEWQALIFGPDNPTAPQRLQKPTGESSRRMQPDTSVGDPEEAAIRELLVTWVESLRERKLPLHLSCYAPRMDRYFLKTNVNADDVREDKQRFLRRYPVLKKLEINDVSIQRSGNVAEANFRKSWDFQGVKPSRGEVASRLLLTKIDGRWRITLEREHYLDGNTRTASLH